MFGLFGAGLSDQSIKRLCKDTKWFGMRSQQPMIMPFSAEKVIKGGTSGGCSVASYDVSIMSDLVLGPHPGHIFRKIYIDPRPTTQTDWEQQCLLAKTLRETPLNYSLANTVENFHMPRNVKAEVADKSTYARLFMSVFNTFIDPGFCGNLQLEIVNHSAETIEIKAGTPICQVVFDWMDRKTAGYSGKYQNQKAGVVSARMENADGSYQEKFV